MGEPGTFYIKLFNVNDDVVYKLTKGEKESLLNILKDEFSEEFVSDSCLKKNIIVGQKLSNTYSSSIKKAALKDIEKEILKSIQNISYCSKINKIKLGIGIDNLGFWIKCVIPKSEFHFFPKDLRKILSDAKQIKHINILIESLSILNGQTNTWIGSVDEFKNYIENKSILDMDKVLVKERVDGINVSDFISGSETNIPIEIQKPKFDFRITICPRDPIFLTGENLTYYCQYFYSLFQPLIFIAGKTIQNVDFIDHEADYDNVEVKGDKEIYMSLRGYGNYIAHKSFDVKLGFNSLLNTIIKQSMDKALKEVGIDVPLPKFEVFLGSEGLQIKYEFSEIVNLDELSKRISKTKLFSLISTFNLAIFNAQSDVTCISHEIQYVVIGENA